MALFHGPNKVTSNPAEGLFGRLKAFCRRKGISKCGKNNYGLVMAEFLWRTAATGPRSVWRSAPFFALVDLIRKWQTPPLPSELLAAPGEITDEICALAEQFRQDEDQPEPELETRLFRFQLANIAKLRALRVFL